ncbi:MAG: sulfatase-like hydrolase/transferase [Clostridiales bacterium]|nr:sulfatase-like hydrolase/transferase [Clostridiales bacterium]
MNILLKHMKNLVISVVSRIKKADTFFENKKVYALVCLLLVAVISAMLGNSFYQTETYSNYVSSKTSSIRLEENQIVRFSFEAMQNRLTSLDIEKDASKSRLDEADTLELSIFDKNGVRICSKEAFLYHPHRTYISVGCSQVNLDRGEQYVAEIKVTSLSSSSVLYLKMHRVNAFTDTETKYETHDKPMGFTYVPNVSYGYSVVSMLSMLIHVSVFVLAAILLLFDRTRRSRAFCEFHRGFFIIMFLYIFTEMLNVARENSLRFLFPFQVKTLVLIISAFLILLVVYTIIYAATSYGTLAIFITSVLVFVLGYVNHSKIVMRGDPFMPWDIYAAGVAAKCSSQYDFRVTPQFVASFFMIAAILLMIRLTHQPRIKSSRTRIIGGLLAVGIGVAMTFGFVLNVDLHKRMDISYSLFPPLESFNENGTILSFFLHANNIRPKGTEDNSPELTEDIIDKYVQIANQLNLDRDISSDSVKPNVICVMSESYADLRMIRDFETSEPVMPYYDSILDETLHGDLQVSVFAGGTCNTEFEFLTGYSVSGLLAGSSVYTFYVKNDINAIPRLFRDEGYRTVAIHPFDPQWWDRTTAYPMLGFDEYISQEDFVDRKYIRRFISDESAFLRLIEEYEKTDSETPFFAFCVTMQNHADYSIRWENQNYDIKLSSFDEYSFPYAENYFSLLRESDDALKLLIEYFRKIEEPTIIVFFGDHLATLDHGFYDLLLDNDVNQITAEESIPLYSTPYFIWANYEMPTGYAGKTSPNFLGQTVLDYAGIPSPDQRACLRVLREKISAISALAVFDNEGTPVMNRETLDDDVAKIIEDYERIQYGGIYYANETEVSDVLETQTP